MFISDKEFPYGYLKVEDIDFIYSAIEISDKTQRVGTCLVYSRETQYNNVIKPLYDGPNKGTVVRINAHRLALFKKMRSSRIPETTHASHLCGRKGCINIDHISPEPSHVNNSRIICHADGVCDTSAHGEYPPCIFD